MSTIELRRPARRALAASPLERGGWTLSVAALHVGLLLLATATAGLFADSWLALVAGREIAAHGLPARDALAAATLGRRWVDQQWLGDLTLYGLARAVGGHLALAVTSLTAAPAIVGALALGRRRAGDAAVAVAGALALVPFLAQGSLVRTQSLAYPLFVLLLALLTRPQTRATRLGAIGVVALWANLHGSVLLAAGVASLRWLEDARTSRARTALLLAATWLATLASPYALGLPAYYRSTLLNPAFATVLDAWRPLTLTPALLPVWLLIGAVVWAIARSRRTILAFEPAVLLALVALTLHSVRIVTFLALAAAALLPAYLPAAAAPARGRSPRAGRVAAASLALAGLLALAAVAHAVAAPYPPRAAAVAARTAGSGRAFAPLELGDWLLWLEPGLRGRVAVDARAELLTPAELRRFAGLWERPDGWRAILAPYRTVVLSPAKEPALVRRLLALPGQFRVAYRDEALVVLVRRAR